MPHFVHESEPERELDPVSYLVHSIASGIYEYEGFYAWIKRVIPLEEYILLQGEMYHWGWDIL